MKILFLARLRRLHWPLDTALRFTGMVLVSIMLLSTMAVTDPGARFNDLGHRMMCTCGCNQIMVECNHVGCPVSPVMRNELQAGIDRGDNDDLVLESFVQRYGPVVLAAPRMVGFSRLAWIMPFLVLTLGLAGAASLVRRWRLRTASMPAVPSTPDFERQRAVIRRSTEI
ncbi:MAG TPA: cytochrome c-type biogenesis protein CcmH [Acidisarcina sp.]